eukprot:15957553-Heterocapsa_arctica.AAC.1
MKITTSLLSWVAPGAHGCAGCARPRTRCSRGAACVADLVGRHSPPPRAPADCRGHGQDCGPELRVDLRLLPVNAGADEVLRAGGSSGRHRNGCGRSGAASR